MLHLPEWGMDWVCHISRKNNMVRKSSLRIFIKRAKWALFVAHSLFGQMNSIWKISGTTFRRSQKKKFEKVKNYFLSKKHFLKLVFYVKVRTMEDEEVVGYEEGTSAVLDGTRLIYAHVRFHHSIFTLACWHDDETNPQREIVVK